MEEVGRVVDRGWKHAAVVVSFSPPTPVDNQIAPSVKIKSVHLSSDERWKSLPIERLPALLILSCRASGIDTTLLSRFPFLML